MKLILTTNNEIIIGADQNKAGDWKLVERVTDYLVNVQGNIELVIAASEEGDYMHLGTRWDNYQAKELKEMYKEAKAAVKLIK